MSLLAKRHSIRSPNAANILLAVICAVVLAACEDSDTEDTAGPGTPEASDAADVSASPEDTGPHLSGKITLDGPCPVRAVLNTALDPECTKLRVNEPLLSDHEIVGEDGAVKNVFVYIREAPKGDYPVPAEQLILDQIGCRHVPHVFGIQIGQELSVRNSDPVLHNIHSFARVNRPFNNAQPKGAPPCVKKFCKVELSIRMKCDIHPWTESFIFAMDHPFFATTDESGAYTIHRLPPGDYTLVAWHEKYGEQETAITIAEDEGTAVDFLFLPTE